MRSFFVGFIAILLFGGLSAVSAKQTQELSVQINKEATSTGGVTVKFLELIEDSRCPTDTNCIWAGNAKIKVEVTKPGHKAKTLTLNTRVNPQSVLFGGYQIKITGLTPEPRTNIRIRKDGYVATFTIAKVYK